MIWDKITFLRNGLFQTRNEHADYGIRWQAAANRERSLVADVIRLCGLLTQQPRQDAEVAAIDPLRLAYEAGRRDLGLELLALMNLTHTELANLMEDNNV